MKPPTSSILTTTVTAAGDPDGDGSTDGNGPVDGPPKVGGTEGEGEALDVGCGDAVGEGVGAGALLHPTRATIAAVSIKGRMAARR
jgi:hypothetical protein